VLKSSWRVWVPDGFSFSEIESNLPVPQAPVEDLLVQTIGRVSRDALGFGPAGSTYEKARRATQVLEDLRIVDSPVDQFAIDALVKPDAKVAITRKLNNIRFPKIDFRDATLREAVVFLVQKSRQVDEEKQGVSIELDAGSETAQTPRITLTLNNVPLIEVIKYVTNLADVKYKIEPNRVRIAPLGSMTEEFVTKQWKVSASVFRAAAEPNAPAASAKDFLMAYGMVFPPGASATYNPSSNTLIVRNTEDQMDLVDRIVEMETEPAAQRPAENERPTASAPNTTALQSKLNGIIFPKIDFKDATVREAVEFLSAKAKSLDPDGQGVNIVMRLGDEHRPDAPGGGTRISLTLNNVPLIEVIKYITNLANLKYKIEPFAVTITQIGTQTEELFTKQWRVPPSVFNDLPAGKGSLRDAKAWLESNGVTFPQGSVAMYSAATSTLIVKNTEDNLELLEKIVEIGMVGGPAPAGGDAYFDRARGWKTAGLLPVTLDLPKGGRVLVFEGLFAPERVALRYDDWWSRARALWMWFVSGGVAFYLLAERRPWWRTLWAVLVLSALPLCASAAWMPECNALLGGWLAGLVLNRIGAWCVFRVKKEVLA